MAGNYFGRAEPDGLTVMGTSAHTTLNSTLRPVGTEFSTAEMRYVCGNGNSALLFTIGGFAEDYIDFLTAKGIYYGHSSAISSSSTPALIAMAMLNVPVEKYMFGYSGDDNKIGILNGEITVSVDSAMEYFSTLRPYEEKGEMDVLFGTGLVIDGEVKRDPLVPDMITVKDIYEEVYGKTPSGLEWNVYRSVVAMTRNTNKLTLLPAGTPDNILHAYWEMARQLVEDPAMKAEMERMVGAEVPFFHGAEGDKMFRIAGDLPQESVDWLKLWLNENIGLKFG